MSSITPADLMDRIDRNEAPLVLDVRTRTEFAAGHVPGAMNIPFTKVWSRAADISLPGETVVVYCARGPRAGWHRSFFVATAADALCACVATGPLGDGQAFGWSSDRFQVRRVRSPGWVAGATRNRSESWLADTGPRHPPCPGESAFLRRVAAAVSLTQRVVS